VGVGVTALFTVVAAVGDPLAQDTTMVTLLAVAANTTRALVAGPRATLLAWKPCWGLHDTRKAPAGAHCATTVPPDEARTVPPVLAVPPVPPAPLVVLVPLFPAVLWGRGVGEADGRATGWLACACSAAATVDWLGGAEMPSPSSDTTSRLPAVAAAVPSSQAPAPMTMRVRMLPRSRM
jgi:hypothetical protein